MSVHKQRRNNGEKQAGGITGKGFAPGRSGNPGGRRKGEISLTPRIRRMLSEPADQKIIEKIKEHFPTLRLPRKPLYADVVAINLVLKAAMGGKNCIPAAKKILDRVEGKVKDSVELSGPNGGPIPVSAAYW